MRLVAAQNRIIVIFRGSREVYYHEIFGKQRVTEIEKFITDHETLEYSKTETVTV